MSLFTWKLHGDGKSIAPGAVVNPDERLSWPRSIGIGVQHIAAMFGATFLVPVLTGLPPATTLFFSGIGTILFLLLTKNRVPSYLGSSFAFLGPIAAAAAGDGGMAAALGGVVATGVLLALVGLVVKAVGASWINWMMPPVVTGAIVMVIGFNLASVAYNKAWFGPETVGQNAGQLQGGPLLGIITLGSIALIAALSRGFLGRISIFAGLVVGYVVALIMGDVNTDKIAAAKWVAVPSFTSPTFNTSAILLFVPVVLVLIAENVGHVKAVAAMTGKSLDDQMGNALLGDGLATTLAGAGGGSGTTTYAENIGVMAATRVYSTIAYYIAGVGAILLSLSPKFGAVLSATPAGVLGGASVALFGMIGILGAKIWIESKVNFADSTNILVAGSAVIIGIADVSFTWGDYTFNGIINATLVAVIGYRILHSIASNRGTAAS
ncbi:MAG: nitrate reductase [Actinobacteria bacterium]|nr:nitrate reductase [Actinomycetota bacterium]